MGSFLLSVVIPVYNEEDSIDAILKRLIPIISSYNYELIFVNDGSVDKTKANISTATNANPHIKLVSFSRNFGHQMALSAGYRYAKGDCVVSMDADMQDPPEIIPEMITKWQQGSKIVYAKRKTRQSDTIFKKTTAWGFYQLINTMSEVPIPKDVGDFRLLDRVVVDFLNELPEHSRFLRGLVAWSGYPATSVEFEREARFAGETHYPFGKMLAFAFEGITAFSTKPLHFATISGMISGVLGFVGILYAIVGRLFFEAYWVTGWTALFVGIMFVGGVQLITIGIVGQYVAKIYHEIQRRPMYIVSETKNI